MSWKFHWNYLVVVQHQEWIQRTSLGKLRSSCQGGKVKRFHATTAESKANSSSIEIKDVAHVKYHYHSKQNIIIVTPVSTPSQKVINVLQVTVKALPDFFIYAGRKGYSIIWVCSFPLTSDLSVFTFDMLVSVSCHAILYDPSRLLSRWFIVSHWFPIVQLANSMATLHIKL